MASKEAENKNDPKGPILKSYYEYHMSEIQKTKNYQKNQIEWACNDLKNSTLRLWWAHCISDWFWLMTSDKARLRMDKKNFDLILLNKIEIRPTCEFDGKKARFKQGHFNYEFRTLYFVVIIASGKTKCSCFDSISNGLEIFKRDELARASKALNCCVVSLLVNYRFIGSLRVFLMFLG